MEKKSRYLRQQFIFPDGQDTTKMNNRLKPDFLRAPATIPVEEFQQRTK